jgi:AcrR family transcriptional regulator
MSATKRQRRGSGSRAIAPLYKRLPKGPHGIAPEDVAHHQRIRMHGAMIESVANHGYERTSVKHVIGLAGVSRRAFYEQFDNKDACFKETFDLIVARVIKRINNACATRKGDFERRLRAALRAFADEIETNPKALRLVMIDALTAGPEAQLQLRKTTATFEQLLASGFASSPNARTLPAPIVRAIIGGLRRATFQRLIDERTTRSSKVSDELLRWMLLLTSPEIDALQARPCSFPPFPAVAQLPANRYDMRDDRTRLTHSVVNLALREPFEELSAPHIAEEAGLSIDTFLELFENPQKCFTASLDMLGGELLEVVADPALISPQWPAAVCHAINRLAIHLASNPACTVMLACKTFTAGLRVIEDMVGLTDEVATLLTEGAPRRPRGALAIEGISGALSHTLYTEASAGRAHLLPSQSEYLSYVVLAPFIGAESAVQTIVQARTSPPQGVRESTSGAAAPLGADVPSTLAAAHADTKAPAAGTGDSASDLPRPTDDREDRRVESSPPDGLATLAQAPLGEVRQHDADKQRDHDHDDQWSMA